LVVGCGLLLLVVGCGLLLLVVEVLLLVVVGCWLIGCLVVACCVLCVGVKRSVVTNDRTCGGVNAQQQRDISTLLK